MFAKPNRTIKATAAASLLALLAGVPATAFACGSEPYIGEICTVAFNFCPRNTLPANGQLLPRQSYEALFALLGTTYGGNGNTNFALPDLRGRVTVGTGQGTGLSNVVFGQTRGAESVTLLANQMAAHNHPATFTGTGGGAASGATASGNVNLAVTGSTTSATVTGTVTANVLTTQSAGSTANTPSYVANTAGKSGGTNTYYPYTASSAVNSPTTLNLTAPSTAISGTAAGTVSLPVTGGSGGITGGTVVVDSNLPAGTTTQPVSLLDPGLGMTVCIVTQGIFPSRAD
ncbi:MAG: phage tail protein [Burkholderiaceae bacterium]